MPQPPANWVRTAPAVVASSTLSLNGGGQPPIMAPDLRVLVTHNESL